MCGIVGGISRKENITDVILKGLKVLEYRGYDSAGFAVLDKHGKIKRHRAVGKLIELERKNKQAPLQGKIGIGHTRWATHGSATEQNAHPHLCEKVTCVHNGIIENFNQIKKELTAKGFTFQTDTDTESIVALAHYYLETGLTPVQAAQAATARLQGAYAIVLMFEGLSDTLFVVRNGPPLCICRGEWGLFVASDPMALAGHIDEVTYLEDGDCATLKADKITITDVELQNVERQTIKFETPEKTQGKDGHQHYTLKEICEQPATLQTALKHYILDIDKPKLVGILCGTIAAYWLQDLVKIPVSAEFASEFRSRCTCLPKGSVAIFISQSGETADTLAALKETKVQGIHTIALVNVINSTIARSADSVINIMAGTEIGVASTKAFVNQMALLLLLGCHLAHIRQSLNCEHIKSLLSHIRQLPGLINHIIGHQTPYKKAAKWLAEHDHCFFIGRGSEYPLALEGALKLKELSYIHAQGYAAGELKHGSIALVDPQTPCIVLAPSGPLTVKTISNMHEVIARNGPVILFTDEACAQEAGRYVKHTLIMPEIDPLLAPIVYVVPLQLLAYYTSLERGTDIDQPRNLAKSVTVE